MKTFLPLATLLLLTTIFASIALLPILPKAASDAPKAPPSSPPPRISWTTSRVSGSPDPPHPFKIERAFPKLVFKNPLLMARTGNRFFVGEHAGKIYSFLDDEKVAK